jgi:putative inorganic carbon (hco3(-)) transporter
MLRTLFVVLILIPGLAAAVASRYYALLLYLWYSLFRPQDWLWIDITKLRLSLIMSLLVVIPRGWLMSDALQSRSVKERLAAEAWPNVTHPLTIGMVVFFITSIVAQFSAVDQKLGFTWLDYLWRVFLVGMVAVSLVNTRDRFFAVVAVIAASLGFHSTKAGITSLLGGGVRFDQGLGGAFIDNNGYAMAIVMILPFLVAVGQNAPSKWLRWLFLATVPFSIYTVVSTFSRAGFLAVAAVVLLFAALQRRRFLALGAVILAAAAVFVVVPMPSGYLDRLQTIQTYQEVGEESALSRLHFWRVAVEMVKVHPEGIGLRNYDPTYDQYDFSGGHFGTGRSVHSSHFEVLAENGIAGIVTWILLFVYAFFVCARIRARSRHVALSPDDQRFYFTMANGLMVSMVGFLVGGAFIALSLNDLTWLTFAMVAALDRISAKALTEAELAPTETFRGRTDAAPLFTGAYRRQPSDGAPAIRPTDVPPEQER